MRGLERAFEIILRFYPAAFRADFADEMRAFVRARASEPRYASLSGAVRLWWHVLADGLAGAVRERAACRRAKPTSALATAPSQAPDADPPEEIMVTLIHDARYAVRTLRRRPGFTVVSAITLALGIGATAAIFGVIDAMLFRPLRYPSAEQIVVKAHEAADLDRARMLAELKREVGRLVVQTTATVTGKVLTPEDQKRLAEETAKQIAAK